MGDPRLRYMAPLGLGLAAATVTTLAEGTPDPLPAVALVHALRAAALSAIAFAVVTVAARAGVGTLPTQLSTSGIGFAAETHESTAAVADLQEQVEELRASLDHTMKRLDALDSKS
jgi:hypothetical protein